MNLELSVFFSKLKKKIINWFLPPQLLLDSAQANKLKLLNAVALSLIVPMAAYIPFIVITRSSPLQLVLIDSAIFFIGLIMRYLLIKGKGVIVGIFFLISIGILVTIANFYLGTIQTPAITGYAFIIVAAAVLFGMPGFLSSLLLSSAIIAFLINLQITGILSNAVISTTYEDWILYTVIFTAIGLLTNYSVTLTKIALKETKQEIAEKTRVESLLLESNSELTKRIAEVELLHKELRDRSIRDPLTGVYNRLYLNEILPHEVARAERLKTDLAAIMIDADNFKNINDTFGHHVGDLCLADIASQLLRSIRDYDVVFRLGGEEFLILLPGISLGDAMKKAETIRNDISNLVITDNGHSIRFTISLGVCSLPYPIENPEDLLIYADKALYLSKQNGRNRSTAWQLPTLRQEHSSAPPHQPVS